MIKFHKWILPIVFFICFSPILFASSCILDDNVIGWDYKNLVKQLDEKETFVFYFGTDKCQACSNAKKIIKTDKGIKEAIENFKTKTKSQYAIYWYSEFFGKINGEPRKKFQKQINELFKKRKFKFNKITATPSLLFFKKGELKQQIQGTSNLESNFIKYINQLAND